MALSSGTKLGPYEIRSHTFGKPTALFADEYDFGQALSMPNYDVTRDGRFILLRRSSHGSNLRVAIRWTEELKQIVAAGGVH